MLNMATLYMKRSDARDGQARPAARGVEVYTAPAVKAAVEGASTANGQPVYPSVDGA